uniref:ribosomal protein L18 n=1 Tax=Timspurckia oligopyrenoides TaxID=708627 RepID=UPI001FCCC5DC|nr:ribosomal protein L18 [Timspurckia oligopyrenoides]UNJ17557.1 ribosomal protein L18 [Timspurckia oligopyrenoides]
MKKKSRSKTRVKKHERIRRNIRGTATKPRLSVYKSNNHIYVQLIDDIAGKTLSSSSSLDKSINLEFGRNCLASEVVGKQIAIKSIEQGISEVVFDRGGYLYHGRIKALADAARQNGLAF